MRKILAVLAVAAIAFGCWFYMNRKTTASQRAVSADGVKKDLISFAHAERAYKARHGTYASEDELYTSGAMKTQRPPRDGYTYSWGSSSIGFSIIARCQLKLSVQCPSFSIDQGMQIEQLPETQAAGTQPDSAPGYKAELVARLKSLLAKFQN